MTTVLFVFFFTLACEVPVCLIKEIVIEWQVLPEKRSNRKIDKENRGKGKKEKKVRIREPTILFFVDEVIVRSTLS